MACRDSAATVRAYLIALGEHSRDTLVLSVKDDPSLRTLEAIFTALPPSLTDLFIDDIEELLPPDLQTVDGVRDLLQRMKRLANASSLQRINVAVGTGVFANRRPL